MKRLPSFPTQRVDLEKSLSFTFQNKRMEGVAGDTVGTALFASGVRIVSRSLKYHRPRGLYSLDGESANTLVNVDGLPNMFAEGLPLKEGMKVRAQNYRGSLEKDRLAFIDRLDGFMPAGFYYRLFHKPQRLWPWFEKKIRAAAGTGEVDVRREHPQGRSRELYLKAEVCVLGGGPAGMSAALAAARTGARVVLLEARPNLGGYYDWRVAENGGRPLYELGGELAGSLGGFPNLEVFTQAAVTGLWGDNLVTAAQTGGPDLDYDERYIEVRAHQVVVAMGCIERPLVFENNERPGVMQPSAALRLARTYAILPGKRAVFSVGDDLGLEAALDLKGLGLEVAAVADCRTEGQDRRLLEALAKEGVEVLTGWAASAALGEPLVKGCVLGSLSGGETKRCDCDLLAASAGVSPLAGAMTQAGAKLRYDTHTGFFLPREIPPGIHPAGRVSGYVNPRSVEASGRLAGLMAASMAGFASEEELAQAREELSGLPGPAKGVQLATGPGIGKGRKSFICFDEDGTVKTARQSAAQGFDVPELAKRFGGFGLGPSQGYTPGVNLPLVLGQATGTPAGDLSPTTQRPPLKPVFMSTLAGPGHDIFKRTPLYDVSLELGGVMRRVGVWKRPRFFSADKTSRAEIKNVRENVGLIDVSTLGKFRIHGPGALKALQRVYISNMATVKEGRLKYSAMLNDDGCLVDDGVVTKVGENDYYFTASTGRAGETAAWFRYHTRYDNLDYHLVNLTDVLGAINLAGPKAREVLAKVTLDDVSPEAFKFMDYKEITVGDGVVARAMRLGFVGELSYELHVPAGATRYVWDLLMEAGKEFSIAPFGLEAQFVLRLEKGHVIIGQESEARTNLIDLGLGFLWDRHDLLSGKIGAPALRFNEFQPGRLKLVGFHLDGSERAPGDGAIVVSGSDIEGFVCTSRHSTALGRYIGMALVTGRLAVEGGKLQIYQNDNNLPERFTATVVPTPFHDPEGLRLRM